MRAFSIIALCLLGGLIASCTNLPRSVADPTIASSADPHVLEKGILEYVNNLRAGRKLRKLATSKRLNQLARSYSKSMAQTGRFEHSDINGNRLEHRLSAAGITDWTMAGENLAKTVNANKPGQESVRGWQLSPGHSENLFNADYDTAGTGVYLSGDTVYVTQIYLKTDSTGQLRK